MRLSGLNISLFICLLFEVIGFPIFVHGQQTLQVVTKTIEKNFSCGKTGSLRILGEKAEIEIHGWEKQNMHIKVQLISENKDRKLAEEELEYMHFASNHEPNLVKLSNSFIFPNRHIKILGNLKTRYEIWVPRQYIISIINKFGYIKMNDIETRTMIDAEYSNITLNNYVGYLSIKSAYSDIKAINLNANFDCTADHADISLVTFGGKYYIEDSFGKIDINTKKVLDAIKIK